MDTSTAFQNFFNAESKGKSAKLYIYNEIRDDIDASIISELQKYLKGFSKVDVHINSPGGSVFKGYAMYNTLVSANIEIHVYIDGIAASIASLIALAGNKIFMARNAMLMIHNPSVPNGGDSVALRKTAETLDKIKDQLINVYAKRTGLEAAELTNMMDATTWLNADEALAKGFIDEIFNEVLARNTTTVQNLEANNPYTFYSQYLNTDQMDIKAILNELGLPANTSEADMLTHVKSLKAKVTELETVKITDLVNNAISEGRITESQRKDFTEMAKANFDSTKRVINGLAKPKDLFASLKTGIENNAGETKEKDKSQWKLDDYRKHAPNELKENPELYKQLLKEEFEN